VTYIPNFKKIGKKLVAWTNGYVNGDGQTHRHTHRWQIYSNVI